MNAEIRIKRRKRDLLLSFLSQEYKDTLVRTSNREYFYYNNLLYRGALGYPICIRLCQHNTRNIYILENKVFSNYSSASNRYWTYSFYLSPNIQYIPIDYQVLTHVLGINIDSLAETVLTDAYDKYECYTHTDTVLLLQGNIVIHSDPWQRVYIYRLNQSYQDTQSAWDAIFPTLSSAIHCSGITIIPRGEFLYERLTGKLKRCRDTIIPRTYFRTKRLFAAESGHYVAESWIEPIYPVALTHRFLNLGNIRHKIKGKGVILIPDCVDLVTAA